MESSCPESVCGCFGPLGVEIAVEGIHCGLEHEAAVGAALKVTLDLNLNDGGQTPLQIPANQVNCVAAAHYPGPSVPRSDELGVAC